MLQQTRSLAPRGCVAGDGELSEPHQGQIGINLSKELERAFPRFTYTD